MARELCSAHVGDHETGCSHCNKPERMRAHPHLPTSALYPTSTTAFQLAALAGKQTLKAWSCRGTFQIQSIILELKAFWAGAGYSYLQRGKTWKGSWHVSKRHWIWDIKQCYCRREDLLLPALGKEISRFSLNPYGVLKIFHRIIRNHKLKAFQI